MDISFRDFTEKKYRKLLKIAKQNYEFIGFSQIKQSDKFIILRHDVDFSPNRAYGLAKIEKEEGIVSTYFLQLNSYFYNIFEKENKEIILEISKLGHRFGLHFNPEVYDINNEDKFLHWLGFEKNCLEQFLGVKIGSFSFHNPTAKILASYPRASYLGLVNTYALKHIAYCSDSNGYWRFERLEDILVKEKYDKLQILIHPGWWQEKPMAPWERIRRCIDGRKDFVIEKYRDTLKKHKRKNIRK